MRFAKIGFRTRPDRPRGPPSPLYSGYRVSFPQERRSGSGGHRVSFPEEKWSGSGGHRVSFPQERRSGSGGHGSLSRRKNGQGAGIDLPPSSSAQVKERIVKCKLSNTTNFISPVNTCYTFRPLLTILGQLIHVIYS